MADIVIVNPRFEVSYWGLEHALPLFGKQANLPVASLPLLAALTPAKHRVTLLDENVEPLDYDRLAKADIVGLTGMIVQRSRMVEILTELRRRHVFVVVGGPWVTVEEDYFDGLVDAVFIGEAEETWPQFLREWEQGLHQTRYEQVEKTDMTKVPTPRLDLLQNSRYMFGSLQFSRGCPFQCEFCDIIVTFGRRPRLKVASQILDELDELRRHDVKLAFVVDDNLIGNKKSIKPILQEVARWQQRHGFPISFFTEASLDLSEDDELLDLMGEANFHSVFIGIESPNEESLRETMKYQNVRGGQGTIVEKVHKIQDSGMEVWCGMILGFDHDDVSIFERQREFLHEARIAHAMVGMLYAVPKTPLHSRLREEGRLDTRDRQEFGTNVIPLLMSREELLDGYVDTLQKLYEPNHYFDRLDRLYGSGNFRSRALTVRTRSTGFWRRSRHRVTELTAFAYVFWRLMRHVPQRELRQEYRRRIWELVRKRPEPGVCLHYAIKCAMHYHHYTMSQNMAKQESAIVSTF